MRNTDHDNASIAPRVTQLQQVLLWAVKLAHRAGHNTSQRQAAVVRVVMMGNGHSEAIWDSRTAGAVIQEPLSAFPPEERNKSLTTSDQPL